MKLKYSFECIDVDDEIIAVPVGKNSKGIHGVLKLNKTGKEILDLLTCDTSEERIVNALADRYEDDREQLISYVQAAVDALHKAGLLDE